jgi:hypothetical protein
MRIVSSIFRASLIVSLSISSVLSVGDAYGQSGEGGYQGNGESWPAGAGPATFAIATDNANTFINAPSANGVILFNANNGACYQTGCAPNSSILSIDNDGTLLTDGTISAYGYSDDGMYGSINGFGAVGTGIGVYGQANVAAVEGVGMGGTGSGVVGLANGGTTGSTSGIAVFGVSGSTNTAIYGLSQASSGGNAILGGLASTDNTGYAIYGSGGAYAVFAHGNLGYTGSLTHVSDERLKKNIAPLVGSMDQLLRLRGVSFEWREPEKHGNASGMQRGFIAQEYEKVFPEWVKTDKDGIKSIDTTGLDALEVEGIRLLKLQNDELRERVKALEAERRPHIAGFGDASAGLMGLSIVAGAVIISRRKRTAIGV